MFYLGYVSGGVTTKAEGNGKRIDKRMYVKREIEDLGVEVCLPLKMEFIRRGKDRRARPHISPVLPNYIFVNTPPERFTDVVGVKYLAPTLMALTRADVAAMTLFSEIAAQDYAAAERIAGNQDAISEYVEGQKLQVLSGGLRDHALTFKRMIDRASDMYPKVQAEMKVLGQTVTVELDPLQVKAAE